VHRRAFRRSPPLNPTASPRHGPDPVTDYPDVPLLRAIAAGDGAACRTLVDRHLPRLHALAARLLDDRAEAEDACQDAFMKAWDIAPRWRTGQARFSTWLHGVVLNGCRDRLRRRKPRDDAALDTLTADDAGPAQRHADEATARAVRRAIATLPERQREALVLCHFQGLPQAEAARLLDTSVDALESLLARARRTLRDTLAPYAPPGGSTP